MKFAGFDDWIPVFRTGTHTDSIGNTRTWTEEDLDKIVSQYSPEEHEAPAVIGHPAMNAPAYGWVEKMKRVGEDLLVKLKDVVPEFAEMVKKGLFKKRSIALYPDLSLRHVGFLGAMPPAVKGLPDISFSQDDAIVIEFMDDFQRRSVADIFRRLREWLIEKFGAETADRVVPGWSIEDLSVSPETQQAFAASDEVKEAQKKRSKKYGIAVKEGGHVTKPSEWEAVPDDQFLDPVNYRYPCPDADQTRAAASYWGQEKNQAQYSTEERAKIEARLDKLKKKHKIGEHRKEGEHMSFKDRLKAVFTKAIDELPEDGLPKETTFSENEVAEREAAAAKKAEAEARKKVEAEFAEKERRKQREAREQEISSWCEQMVKQGKLTPALVKYGVPEILTFLAASDDVIEFGEEKSKATPYERFKGLFETELPRLVDFGEVAGRGGDPGERGAGEKLEKLTKERMRENKDLSYSQAFAEVQKDHPDLAREYQAELGIEDREVK